MKGRSIFATVLVLGLFLTAASFTGTLSYFSDLEVSKGNSLEAGDLDLEVTHEYQKVCKPTICNPCNCDEWWPQMEFDGGKIFDVDGLKRFVWGKALLKVHLFGNPAWVQMKMDLTSNVEGLCDCGCSDGEGELAQNVHMLIWQDYDGDGKKEYGERKLFIGTMDEFLMDEELDGDSTTLGIQALENCEDYYIGIKWWVDLWYCPTEIWGDSLTFDIIFNAYQRRNQDDYYATSQDQAYFDIENSLGNQFMAWSPCSGWDKSSLEFQDSWHDEPNGLLKAEIKNGDDSEDMEGPTDWELWYTDQPGPPKWGSMVDSGTVPALDSGQSTILQSNAVSTHGSGNYMFKAYQRPGHPGTGVLWSDEIEVGEE